MAFAALIGISLGVLGAGGSIVTLPVLVYVAHIPPKEAVGMSLAIVGATSLFGALLHLRRGNVALKTALMFAVTGMAGSFVGSTGTHLVSKQGLLLLFAGLMLVVGFLMWRGGLHLHGHKTFSVPRCLAVGFAVGLLAGFLGVGGGFLIVPALVLTAGLDARMAGATSLAVIALNSTTGLLGQLRYVHLDWSLLAGFIFFAFAGMLAGIAFAQRVHVDVLRRLFAAALIILGVVMAVLNI